MAIKTISPVEVFQLNQEAGGITIIDVREAEEYAEVCSAIAENFPLSRFDPREFSRTFDSKAQVYVLCRSGKRSLRAAEMLEAAGFDSIYNVEGGMIAWEGAGLPVVRGKPAR